MCEKKNRPTQLNLMFMFLYFKGKLQIRKSHTWPEWYVQYASDDRLLDNNM
jgi:hypothetical protein